MNDGEFDDLRAAERLLHAQLMSIRLRLEEERRRRGKQDVKD